MVVVDRLDLGLLIKRQGWRAGSVQRLLQALHSFVQKLSRRFRAEQGARLRLGQDIASLSDRDAPLAAVRRRFGNDRTERALLFLGQWLSGIRQESPDLIENLVRLGARRQVFLGQCEARKGNQDEHEAQDSLLHRESLIS